MTIFSINLFIYILAVSNSSDMTVQWEPQDLRKLIEILGKYEFFSDKNDLRMILSLLGFRWLASDLNYNQNTQTLIFAIVNRLSTYGQDEYGHEAVGKFLNGLIDANYVTDHQDKVLIKSFVEKYRMMPPISVTPEVPGSKISQSEETNTLEKIIGENTLRPIAFLTRAIEVSKCVCFVGVPGGSGTGFLLADNLVMTNNHVIHDAGLLSRCFFRFNYQIGVTGSPEPTTDYNAKQGGIFCTHKDLDYTVIELEGSPGTKWGYSKLLSSVNVRPKESRVNIIQHPAGGPKQVSVQNNFLEYMDNNVMQYVTSTLNGSSGSPVFDDNWQVVALHHSGGMITEPSSQRRYFRNEGILVPAILSTLPEEVKKTMPT
jgi:V8-like Glu-specific endopeptidase